MTRTLLASALATAITATAAPAALAEGELTVYSGDFESVTQSEGMPGGPGFALFERRVGFELASGANTVSLGGLPRALDAASVVLTPPEGDAPSPDGPYAMLLGIAQDGGRPQIGCRLSCCADVERELVVSLLVVDPRAGRRWLIDASPDLAEQVALCDGLPPTRISDEPRPPLFDGIFLTHAHMGHYTGLMYFGLCWCGQDNTQPSSIAVRFAR